VSKTDIEVRGAGGWADLIVAISGGSRVRNILPRDAEEVKNWQAALMADLQEPPNSADLSIIGTLGRLMVLELRLGRILFTQGSTLPNGEERPAYSRFCVIVRLKLDLQKSLKFRSSKTALPLAGYLKARSEAPGSTIVDTPTSLHPSRSDRVAAPATRSEAAILDAGDGVFDAPAPGAAANEESSAGANGPPPGVEGRRGDGGDGLAGPSLGIPAASQFEPAKAEPSPFNEEATAKHQGRGGIGGLAGEILRQVEERTAKR
jgi:hypothetical protein